MLPYAGDTTRYRGVGTAGLKAVEHHRVALKQPPWNEAQLRAGLLGMERMDDN